MISKIGLQYFRSYTGASFGFDVGVNIIVGPNASGKTNLLESILVVAHGGSYRAKDAELVAHDAPWTRLDAVADEQTRTVKLEVSGELVKKSFVIDGQVLTRLHSSRMLPVVLFEPNHLLLLSGAPDLRRTFMDDMIEQTDPGFAAIRKHYRRVLSQRNALLKRHPSGITEHLFVWNLRLSELGGQIARRRQELVTRCNERLGTLYSSLAGREHTVALHYATRFTAANYETELLRKLETSTELDVARGFTAYGPHRDDMTALIDGKPVAEAASRGEARTLVLALKILELQQLEGLHDTAPLLLLDDVFSELDAARRKALTQYVENYQTFITTTDADVVQQHFKNSNIIALKR